MAFTLFIFGGGGGGGQQGHGKCPAEFGGFGRRRHRAALFSSRGRIRSCSKWHTPVLTYTHTHTHTHTNAHAHTHTHTGPALSVAHTAEDELLFLIANDSFSRKKAPLIQSQA